MKKLLIVAHTPSHNTETLTNALLTGASETPDVSCSALSPFETQAQHVLDCDGLILLTPENFGYMSGALKDFFDRCYYDLIESKRGLPYALVIRAGKDGTGTQRAVEGITKGLGWRKVQDALVLQGEYDPEFESQTKELSEAFAAGLGSGVF